MGNGYEEALHQGYSAEEMARDIREAEQRAEELGCRICKYQDYNSPTCRRIFEDSGLYKKCPYFMKKDFT